MLFALPTQVFSFVATETGSKALRTGAGYTCRICPSLRWKERVFSSSLSRSLVAAPDIFSQSRIHPLKPAARKQSNQKLLSFPVNSSLPVYIYKTSSTRCLMRERFPWMQYRLFSHNVVTMETSAIGWPPWLIAFWYLLISEQLYMLMHEAMTWFLQIQRYQNGINQGGHPIALVSMATTLCETSLYWASLC